MYEKPRISVLMAVYNGERYLAEAIDSVLSQTFEDFEFIIVDDGSTDTSFDIAASYDDKRIKIIRNERNIRLQKSLNMGLALAEGEYVARMDADDISLPERFERQVKFLDENGTYWAVASKSELIDLDGKSLGPWPRDEGTLTGEEIRAYLPFRNCIVHGSMMIRSDILKGYWYDENILKSQDYMLWLKICSEGGMIGKLDEVLYRFRVHPGSVSGAWSRDYYWKIAGHKWWVYILFFWFRLKKCRFNSFDYGVLKGMMRNIGLMISNMPKDLKKFVWHSLYRLKKFLLSV